MKIRGYGITIISILHIWYLLDCYDLITNTLPMYVVYVWTGVCAYVSVGMRVCVCMCV